LKAVLCRLVVAAACAGGAAAPSPAADACGGGHRWLAESAPYRVAFTPRLAGAKEVAGVPVGQHFEIDIHVCSARGAAAVRKVGVDADMPAHRHGMNYRASVEPLGAGRWRAKGLLFHMSGRWRFVFDLDTASGALRLTYEVEVP
jgi:hypothetical protein